MMKIKNILFLILGLVASIAGVLAYAARRWTVATRRMYARLEAVRRPVSVQRYSSDELIGLPAPVQRYFRTVLQEGQPIVTTASIEHIGTFNLSETSEQWKPFTSTQRVITRRPGFVWAGRIAILPGLTVLVHDAYIAGEGILHVMLAGLLTHINLRDTGELARGELMRFVAETAWYPTALLPSQGVQWAAVDDTTADATFTDGDLTLTMRFRFTADGLIDSVWAEARGRTVDEEVIPTPWEGRWSDYEQRDGMVIPLAGEAVWLPPEGPKTYWRGRITQIQYEFA